MQEGGGWNEIWVCVYMKMNDIAPFHQKTSSHHRAREKKKKKEKRGENESLEQKALKRFNS
jgi:hypothetical protein